MPDFRAWCDIFCALFCVVCFACTWHALRSRNDTWQRFVRTRDHRRELYNALRRIAGGTVTDPVAHARHALDEVESE